MPFTPTKLAQSFPTNTTEATVYTVGAGKKAILKQVILANVLASQVVASLSLVPTGGTAGDSNRMFKDILLGANAVLIFDLAQVLNTGDFISVKSGTASSIVYTVSGVEF